MSNSEQYDQYLEALKYKNGTDGYEKDEAKANDILTKLAKDGYAKAQLEVALAKYHQKDSFMIDDSVIELLTSAAEGGEVEAKFWLGKILVEDKNDFAKAATYLQEASDAGHSKAKALLGLLYFRGAGVQKNLDDSLALILASAEQGFAQAQFDAGYILENGICGIIDFDKAYYWYSQASQNGHSYAKEKLQILDAKAAELKELIESSTDKELDKLFVIAHCYLKGCGIAQNYEKAVHYLELITSQEYEEAYGEYKEAKVASEKALDEAKIAAEKNANNIDELESIAKEKEKFCKFKARSANAIVSATGELGWCYFNGYGVPQDYSKAFELYLRAAKFNDMKAQNNVGWCYAHGLGVQQDYFEAVKWYLKAADRTPKDEKSEKDKKSHRIPGDLSAQKNLAWCYQHHLGTDLTQEEADNKAFKFYRSAAIKKDPEAICCVAYFYKNGIGVKKDLGAAFEHYKEAAVFYHNATACCNLGWFFERGIGVPSINIERAIFFYRQAAAQGIRKAQERLDVLLKKQQ